MEAAKEKASNISAAAKAGMDKSKATAEEKVDKVKTRDPLQKEIAEDRKDEKIHKAELEKQQEYEQNAIKKGEAHHTGVGHQTGLGGHHTGLGGHQTGVGHQTGLEGATGGAAGLHRTDAPVTGTKTNVTGHETGSGL